MSEPGPKPDVPKKKKIIPKDFAGKLIELPEAPTQADLGTDITAIVPQLFQGKRKVVVEEAAAAPQPTVQAPRMFQRRPAAAPAPAAPVPRPNPTTTTQPVPAPAPVQETEAPEVVLQEPIVPPALPQAEIVARETTGVPSALMALQSAIDAEVTKNPYTDPVPGPFYPEDRRGFQVYIPTYYKDFKLPALSKRINPNACNEMTLQTYKYQAFIREFMRQASPYRGILVYHGLGSGKTCTSIATAEALYGQSNKKIIVMTPISLQENFINEIMFCGFKHYRLQNVWVPFSLKEPEIELFAESVVGIPKSHIQTLRTKPADQQVIWMPDMTKTKDDITAQELQFKGKWQQTSIRDQLYAIIRNKITFIGYTGIRRERRPDERQGGNPVLMDFVRDKTFFDNAVVIIDEVHNLTRLMAGKVDGYLHKKKAQPGQKEPKQLAAYEPVSIGPWEPKSSNYERAILFYRLLCQAKNSKIIALSGTPVVNIPVELGILGNILHGYFHSCATYVQSLDDNMLGKLQRMCEMHPRLNFFSLKKSDTGITEFFFTILNEGYIKQLNADGTLAGLIYKGIDDPLSKPETIFELHQDILARCKAEKIPLSSTAPSFDAMPLFPPSIEEFNETFVKKDDMTLTILNQGVFAKRMSGLVSYYRGSKEELMPKVLEDTEVYCPMSDFQLGPYQEARAEEILSEKSSPTGDPDDSNASYRFKSRSLCNFAFPKDIERPFPSSKEDYEDAAKTTTTLVGDGVTDIVTNPQAVAQAEAAEAQVAAEEVPQEAPQVQPQPKVPVLTKEKLYKIRKAEALQRLTDRASEYFKLDTTLPPEQQLRTYSNKFATMIQKILEGEGSSLVYSQFRTLEGVGIFSIACDANGFAPIKLTGPDNDLQFHPDTAESLQTRPDQPRYIMYSGEETTTQRQTLINIFNMRIEKLPKKIQDVLLASPLQASKNHKGEVCRIFMITSAGAEGLSLRNVRAVHIMEPFWNKVRTDQVKGRAVRICSHSDLQYDEDDTKNQRTVRIYTYFSVFAKSQRPIETIQRQDRSRLTGQLQTTDQFIYELATIKDQLNTGFLSLMKAAAVDCRLNLTENKTATDPIQCFVQEGSIHEYMYDPRLDKDISLSKQQVLLIPGQGQVQPKAPEMAPNVPMGPAIRPAEPQELAQQRLLQHVTEFYVEFSELQGQAPPKADKIQKQVEEKGRLIWPLLKKAVEKKGVDVGVVEKHKQAWEAGLPKPVSYAQQIAPGPTEPEPPAHVPVVAEPPAPVVAEPPPPPQPLQPKPFVSKRVIKHPDGTQTVIPIIVVPTEVLNEYKIYEDTDYRTKKDQATLIGTATKVDGKIKPVFL